MKTEDLHLDPLMQLKTFLSEVSTEFESGKTMTLATSHENQPSLRNVLLKDVTERGLVFYSDYQSQKAQELDANAKASALLYWPSIDTQFRISGEIEKLPVQKSEEYFAQRSRESQLGAWASKQSQVIDSREVLENAYKEAEKKFAGQDIPRPESWGGFLLVPYEAQILIRREHRLHDSFQFRKTGENWTIQRLSP